MRVLMTTMKLDIGGAETHIVELSKALLKQGVEVWVASNGGAYEKELATAGIRHIQVPFHSKNPSAMAKAYRMLKEIILENDIDVVHAHARIPAFLCALLHKRYRFRFVTTAHWVFSTRFPYNLLTRWGDRSLAVSDDIKDYLVNNYGIDPEKIRVTINGIDLEKFSKDTDFSEIAEEFSLSPDKTRIVYVSRMDIDRSLVAHKLIEAVPALLKQIPDLEVVIVGGGNDLATIEAEAKAMNDAAGKRIIITTGSRTDINRFVASGNLFIGVSRAALEAMACEKPAIIAGNEGYIGIFDEDKLQVSIDTNFCCRGCAPTETETLTRDILAILQAPKEEQERLGFFARETVKEHYSVTTMAEDALKMYLSIIKDRPINQVELSEMENIPEYLANVKCAKASAGGRFDVMLSGYYGFHNSGDDSILKAIIDGLRAERPDIRILVLSNDPEETKRLYGIAAIHRFHFLKILWNLRKTRLLISGGGSLIQDVTSDKSLFYYLLIIQMGLWAKTKVMLYANGIGPIRKERNHKHISRVLNQVDLITLREPSSLEELKKYGVTVPKIRITADPAFTLVPAEKDAVAALLENAQLPQDKDYCGIALRPWRWADGDMEKIIASLADEIYEEYGLNILFIPMQEARDTGIAERTLAQMHHRGYILRGTPSPAELLGVVGGSRFIIGMRLHTLIYAARMGTPSIGLIYDPKVAATMDYLGQDFTESAEQINPLTLRRYVDQIMEYRDRYHTELKTAGEISLQKAKENTALALTLLGQ